MQQLCMSTDFLVELADSIFAKVKFYPLLVTKIFYSSFLKLDFHMQKEAAPSFATFSHQAVDFILGKLRLGYCVIVCFIESDHSLI